MKNKDEYTRVPCKQCGYVFYEEFELNKDFVYVDGVCHCIKCLKSSIALSETVRGAGSCVAIEEES
jgi:hypothetical protein